MTEPIEQASTTEGLPVAPSMGPALQESKLGAHATPINRRVVVLCGWCVLLGAIAGLVAQALLRLIWFFTNFFFYGRLSTHHVVAQNNHLGPWVIGVPVVGGVIIGFLLKYGSRAVAGHGIPEAMEQVLVNQSRIPIRMTFLKPFSAAISIGTGGPFGAEGPIIATGGAVGSLIGQLLRTTAGERKTLLAAGAAAGIAAAFGAPVAAVLLAIELLLFEFRPRSIIPVALASAVASALHTRFEGAEPMFPFTGPALHPASEWGLLAYALLGCFVGLAAVGMTKSVYWVEHRFEHLQHRIHWMWHPALGGLVVGLIGYLMPQTLGPGYGNLDCLIAPGVLLKTAAILCVLKWLSWTIALGSGTAGGTLAPVFTIGGSFAAVVGMAIAKAFPAAHMDLRVAALVGMVAIFAGASRALLTSVVFAVETTLQPYALLPALCGCATAYLISALFMEYSIMTEKMARSGVRVPAEYSADTLDQIVVASVVKRNVTTLPADQTVAQARAWMTSGDAAAQFHGYPVVDEAGHLVGVLTRRDVMESAAPADQPLRALLRRPPVFIYAEATLREAADQLASHNIGRLPVVTHGTREHAPRVIGMLTRSDLLFAYGRQLQEGREPAATVRLWRRRAAREAAMAQAASS